MFTGIITHIGKFTKRSGNQFEFSVPDDFSKKVEIGFSVAVSGVCLTVKEKSKTSVVFDIMPETLNKTIFKNLEPGAIVNLELPLTVNTFLSGHILQGHVDGRGRVKGKELSRQGRASPKAGGKSQILKINIPNTLSKYIVNKGSISVNGVSLTVIKAGKNYFTVGIIPFTLENTMLHSIKIGDYVNIEVDILAKYVERLMKK